MKRIVCEMCGSQDVVKQEGMYICNHCGTKYSPEEAKKLFVEVTVTVDHAEEIKNLYALATRARQNNDYENAATYYQQLLGYEPDNWEAAFFSTLCRSNCGTIAEIPASCDAVRNCIDSVFQLIQRLPASEQKSAVQTVVSSATTFANSMFNVALKHHMSIDASVMSRFNADLKARLVAACFIMTSCSGSVMKFFGNNANIAPLVQIPAKAALEAQTRQTFVSLAFEPNVANGLLGYIGKYDPTYVENYKKKQNNSMTAGNVVLMVLGIAFLALGLFLDGTFAKWFCIPMAVFCLGYGLLRIVVQAANKKLNG